MNNVKTIALVFGVLTFRTPRTIRAPRHRRCRAVCWLGGLLLPPGLASAHEPHACPPDYPDTPAISGHIDQLDIASGRYRFSELFVIGRDLFSAQFNHCDGQGRPGTTGTGESRVADEPAFVRTSAPDSNACAGCHNAPRAGGAGDFVANVFVLAQGLDPVTTSVGPEKSNERNTLGMFGGGAIEMLAREMSAELAAQAAELPDGDHVLVTKGIEFEITIAGGAVVSSRGIDTDLVIKPFHQAGVVRSLREFTVNAYNHHHGMQAEERFDLNPDKGFNPDFDGDGVRSELTVGDITAVTLFQAGLAVPGRVLPADRNARNRVEHGERLFSEIGCAACHVPELPLNSPYFVEPNPIQSARHVQRHEPVIRVRPDQRRRAASARAQGRRRRHRSRLYRLEAAQPLRRGHSPFL